MLRGLARWTLLGGGDLVSGEPGLKLVGDSTAVGTGAGSPRDSVAGRLAGSNAGGGQA